MKFTDEMITAAYDKCMSRAIGGTDVEYVNWEQFLRVMMEGMGIAIYSDEEYHLIDPLVAALVDAFERHVIIFASISPDVYDPEEREWMCSYNHLDKEVVEYANAHTNVKRIVAKVEW